MEKGGVNSQKSSAYLLKATEVYLLPELEVQAQIPPVFTHQRGTQAAFLHCQVREHLKIHNNQRMSYTLHKTSILFVEVMCLCGTLTLRRIEEGRWLMPK